MLKIPQEIYNQMIEHCLEGYPLEACGILSGANGEVSHFFPMNNVDQSAVSYTMDSKELLQVTRKVRLFQEEILVIFHSHVASEAYPSQTDVNLAFYPEASYVIISLKDKLNPEAKGYSIIEGEISPVNLQLI